MKLLKTQRRYLTQKIRDNKALIIYSKKDKANELIEKNKLLQIQLDELKIMKHF